MSQQTHEQQNSVVERPLTRLVLTGFMGAGKSTVGALLARMLAWDFLDLDAVIEASSGQSVADIFRDHGEAHFRERERQAVFELSERHHIVLALGGGTIEDEASRRLLLNSPGTCLVFLEGKLTDLIARCAGESKVRPLLGTPDIMEARHDRRLPFYRQAHVTVVTSGLIPQQVADRVMTQISSQWQLEPRKKVVAHGSH